MLITGDSDEKGQNSVQLVYLRWETSLTRYEFENEVNHDFEYLTFV